MSHWFLVHNKKKMRKKRKASNNIKVNKRWSTSFFIPKVSAVVQ